MPTVLSPSFQCTWLLFFLILFLYLGFPLSGGLEVEKANTLALFPDFG